MPIYEYRCTKCGGLFEEWTKSFDSPEEELCPECGGKARRIVSQTTFKLVGSGWFADYGKADGSSAGVAKKKGDAHDPSPAPKAEASSSGAAKTDG